MRRLGLSRPVQDRACVGTVSRIKVVPGTFHFYPDLLYPLLSVSIRVIRVSKNKPANRRTASNRARPQHTGQRHGDQANAQRLGQIRRLAEQTPGEQHTE